MYVILVCMWQYNQFKKSTPFCDSHFSLCFPFQLRIGPVFGISLSWTASGSLAQELTLKDVGEEVVTNTTLLLNTIMLRPFMYEKT